MNHSRQSRTTYIAVELLEPRLVYAAGPWLDHRIDFVAPPPCPRERCRPPMEFADHDRGPGMFDNDRMSRPHDHVARRGVDRGGIREPRPEGEAPPPVAVSLPTSPPNQPPMRPIAPPLAPVSPVIATIDSLSSLTGGVFFVPPPSATGSPLLAADTGHSAINSLGSSIRNELSESLTDQTPVIERVADLGGSSFPQSALDSHAPPSRADEPQLSPSSMRERNDAALWPVQSRELLEEATIDSSRTVRVAAASVNDGVVERPIKKLPDAARSRAVEQRRAVVSDEIATIEFASHSSDEVRRAVDRWPTDESANNSASQHRRMRHAISSLVFESLAAQEWSFDTLEFAAERVVADEGGSIALTIDAQAIPYHAPDDTGASLADIEIQINAALEQSQSFELAGEDWADFRVRADDSPIPATDAAVSDPTADPAQLVGSASLSPSIVSAALAITAARLVFLRRRKECSHHDRA